MRALRKYAVAFSLEMQGSMEYRVDFLLSLVNGSFMIIVQFFLWTAIYNGDVQKELYGYNYSQMIVYVIMAGVLSKVMATGFEYDVEEDIKDGRLSRFLVQPIAYLPYRVLGFLGKKTIQIVMVLIISALVLGVLALTVGAEFRAADIGLAVLVIPLSLLLNCMLFYCISMLGFWMTQAWNVFNGMGVVSMILSGGIFPLDVFGSGARAVFRLLPFQYVVYFPLNILCGRLGGAADFWSGLLTQIVWILLLYALAKLLWKLGMKKYIAAGG